MSTLEVIKKVVKELKESSGYEVKLTVLKNSPEHKKITKWLDKNEIVYDISASRGKEIDLSILVSDESFGEDIIKRFKKDTTSSTIVKL